MTRINVIPPKFLTDEWLLAEHRELKRIPNKILSGVAKTFGGVPKYTLGKGHEIFFRDKLTYLRLRYDAIHKECLKRGFNVRDYTFYISQFSVEQAEKLWNDWEPDDDSSISNIRKLDIPSNVISVVDYIADKVNKKDGSEPKTVPSPIVRDDIMNITRDLCK